MQCPTCHQVLTQDEIDVQYCLVCQATFDPPPQQSSMDFDGSGPDLRDQGIDQVLEHEPEEWRRITIQNVIEYLRTHLEYRPEDLYRYDLMPWPPHHVNAIGGITNALIHGGYMVRDRADNSERTPSHARTIWIYRSLVYRQAAVS